ncbi:MAG: DUF4922 domain-containing protein [Bacteroidales bacterium]|nr:DUF4922 domain-containing protein [Bacteroidales bacterium]MDD2425883.1 DUF4922 domain-containing protein [Bacteroidales bacterium]MDD3989671.1 DUF4922 domain-containing protein [Bacteroidales bacterium]
MKSTNEILSRDSLEEIFAGQLDSWELAGSNYESLKKVSVRDIYVENFPYRVQFNPARISSSAAKVDTASILARKCFLCKENRPQIQKGLKFVFDRRDGASDEFSVLINPFPIFPKHLTIVSAEHRDQLILSNVRVMYELAKELSDYTIFYNGPRCGASAPDHFHFQAGNKGFLPLENYYEKLGRDVVISREAGEVRVIKSGLYGTLQAESDSPDFLDSLITALNGVAEIPQGDKEPMFNMLCWYDSGRWVLHIFLRKKHRPECYYAGGEENILISPAAVDLAGVFITPLEKDFLKISESDIRKILQQVCISSDELYEIAERLKSII